MHIVPALMAGRDVLTNINGINHKKFAELTGIPLPIVQRQLICISNSECDDEEQRLELVKADILEKTKKDSLVVIDEVQDIHPTKRQPLSPEWSKYIASHRHEGLDIVLMGQDRRDVHPIWRRRIQRLITFNKLSAVGAESSYRWECLEATSPEKFKKVTSGIRKYDKQYFGLYLSHTQGTKNKTLYKDDRANILKNKNLQLAVVAFIALAYFGITRTVAFFEPKEIAQTVQAATPQKVAETLPVKHQKLKQSSSAQKPEPPPERPSIDIFDKEARKGRLRLAALVYAGDKLFFRIEVMDSYNRLYAVYDYDSLRDLGWQVENRDSGIRLFKAGLEYIARPWQLENSYAQVNRRQAESLRQ